MSFLWPVRMTKKRFKFQVTLYLEELTAVPFMTGTLYCKVRLKDGGNFVDSTSRAAVDDHVVAWRNKFIFQCKMSADPSTGVLDPCTLRISVRKEFKGGKTTVKVGLVDINLAEFAGSNHTSRHCLLEAYQDKSRQDNSLLKVVIGMHLLSGDPCFKVPTVRDVASLNLPEEDVVQSTAHAEHMKSRGDSDSSGFGSLPRKATCSQQAGHPDAFELCHSRNSSTTSQRSKHSDYGSKHSRTPSCTSQTSSPVISASSERQQCTRPPRPPPPKTAPYSSADLSQDRMGVTRVSADDIINKLMEDQDFTQNTSAEEDGLRLYVSSDGKTALGGQNFQNRAGSSMYQPVVIDQEPRAALQDLFDDSGSR